MRIVNSLIIALSTYSKLPMPQVDWNEDNMRYSMCFFPVVGLVIGLLAHALLNGRLPRPAARYTASTRSDPAHKQLVK